MNLKHFNDSVSEITALNVELEKLTAMHLEKQGEADKAQADMMNASNMLTSALKEHESVVSDLK